MPDPNMTYQDHLEMFGTKEEKEKYKKRLEFWNEWVKDIPIFEPKFPIGQIQTQSEEDK